jgi:hypothetical protein
MMIVENLRATHAVDDRVANVDDRVAEVNDKVAEVIHGVQIIFKRPQYMLNLELLRRNGKSEGDTCRCGTGAFCRTFVIS